MNRILWHRPSQFFRIAAASLVVLLVAALTVIVHPPAYAAAPSARVKIENPDERFTDWQGIIGEDTTFTVHFDNSGPAVGYGPYVDLILPSAGDDGDDGLAFGAASFLGTPLAATDVLTCTGAPVLHPLTSAQVPCPVGSQRVVLALPFGSYTPDQPAAEIVVTAKVPQNMLTGTAQPITAVGGFRFGDSATGGTPVVGAAVERTFTGQAVMFSKRYNGPEHETTTGPNFTREYRLSADVAEGFTVQDFRLVDHLPAELQFVAVTGSSGGTTIDTPSSTVPGGKFVHSFGDLTGTAAAEDAWVTFSWFVPKDRADNSVILDPGTGNDLTMTNDGSWVAASVLPVDPDDPELTGAAASGNAGLNQYQTKRYPDDHQLVAKSIAVQKTANAHLVRPGQEVQFTVRTQVSDYFTVGAVAWTDQVPDGVTLVAAPTTARVIIEGQAPQDVALTSSIITDAACAQNPAGRQTLALALPAGLVLPGGRVNGTNGGTTIEFSYAATVADEYRCGTNGSNVSAADELVNTAVVDANILDNTTQVVTDTEQDGTAEELELGRPSATKTVHAQNGTTSLPAAPVPFETDDEATYRVQVRVPSGDLQDFVVTDYLPLPVFNVTNLSAIGRCVGGVLPAVDELCYGPDDQMHPLKALPNPTLNPAQNTWSLNYGEVSNPNNTAILLDLLFTVRVLDAPFVDGLHLTNQVSIDYRNNDNETFANNAIAQIKLSGPMLQLRKGITAVTSTSDPAVQFVGGPRGTDFPAPAPFDCAVPRFTDTEYATGAPDADVVGADVGEIVRYTVAVRNKGHNDAANVIIGDQIHPNMMIPAAGLNLCVRDGAGNPLGHTATGFFDDLAGNSGTITLTDWIRPVFVGNGENIALISYDLQIDPDAPVGEKLPNTATINQFTAPFKTANFANLVPAGDRSDDAAISTKTVTGTKTITDTSAAHTTGKDLTIGEEATYQVVFTLPEGRYTNVVLTDQLPPQLGVLSAEPIQYGAQIDGPANRIPTFTVDGQNLTVTLNDVTNFANDLDRDDETITLIYRARMRNVPNAIEGQGVPNTARMTWGAGLGAFAQNAVVVREPAVTTTKVASPRTIQAGQTVTYVVQVANRDVATGADAFGVRLTDQIPAELTIVPGSLKLQDGSVTPTSGPTVTGNTVTATFDRLDRMTRASFEYQAVATSDLVAPSTVTNTATTTWSSLPGDVAGERNGSDGVGGLNDYAATGTGQVHTFPGAVTKTLVGTSADHTSAANLVIGESAEYELTVTLPEGNLTNGFTVTDQIPAGLAYVAGSATVSSAGFGGTLGSHTVQASPGVSGADVTWTFAATTLLANNDSADNQITLRVRAVLLDEPSNTATPVTTLVNVAAVRVGAGPPVTSSPVAVNVVEPAVQLAKSANPASVVPGTTTTFTLVATNTGTAAAFAVSLTDPIPAVYLPGSITPKTAECGFTPTVSGATLQYTGGRIDVGQRCVLTFTATVSGGAAAGSVENTVTGAFTAHADGTGRAYAATPASATVGLVVPDLAVVKTNNQTTVTPGAEVTYAIAVTNSGSATADGVLVSDTLPPGSTVKNTAGSAAECVPVADPPVGTVQFTLAQVAVNQTISCSVTVTISDQLPAGTTTMTNTVTVTDPGASYTDPSPQNNTATDVDRVVAAAPDLRIAKTDQVTEASPGATLRYTVTVRNIGNIAATNVDIVDVLSDHVIFESCTVPAATVTEPCEESLGIVTVILAELAAGASASVLITAKVAGVVPAAVATIDNTVTVTDDGVNGTDPDTANNTATDVDNLVHSPDLTISKTDNTAVVVVGSTITYQITVANVGDAAATGVTVTDTLWAGSTFVSCSDDCVVQADGSLLWQNLTETDDAGPTPNEFDHTHQKVLTITVKTTGGAGQYTNTVSVSDDGRHGADPTPDNNVASDTNTVVPARITTTNLVLRKTTLTNPVVPGAPVSYALTVLNEGPATVDMVTLQDALPTEFGAPSYTASVGNYLASSGAWTGVNLKPGDQATLTVTALLASSATGVVTNTAVVKAPSDLTESNLDDNTASAESPLRPQVRVELAKALIGDLVTGRNATYTMTMTNLGPSDLTRAVLSDQLPGGLEFISAGGPGWTCVLTRCTYAQRMTPGQKATVTVVAKVVAPAGDIVANRAIIESVIADPYGDADAPVFKPVVVKEPVLTVKQSDDKSNPTPTVDPPATKKPNGGTGTGLQPPADPGAHSGTPEKMGTTGAWIVRTVYVGVVSLALGLLVLFFARRRRAQQ